MLFKVHHVSAADYACQDLSPCSAVGLCLVLFGSVDNRFVPAINGCVCSVTDRCPANFQRPQLQSKGSVTFRCVLT
jgi:hypothetical protein